MCGINGIVDLDSQRSDPVEAEIVVRRMNDAIAHRGPDGEGTFAEHGVALGHRRLAILDLSPSGHQPMASQDGRYVLTFNGEIYNYLELIPELVAAGCEIRTRSDTEVILHAYALWGESCVSRFNGMWAFAVWDRWERTLFASRDRFGVKPLLFSRADHALVFSSEVAGLKAALPLRTANLGKLYDYLAFGYRVNDGETFWEGVHELAPGHCMRVRDGRVETWPFWRLKAEVDSTGRAEDRIERLRALLSDAVRIRFRSDVPVALLQSGGLDSSIICAIVDREISAGRLSADTVTAFTAVHPGHPYDEAALVRELVRDMDHVRSVEVVPPGDRLGEMLPEYVAALQDPQASATSFAHWVLMRQIAERGVKVVLNGQGADECFAGYGALIAGYRLLDVLLTQPSRARREFRSMRRVMGLSPETMTLQAMKAVAGRRAASRWRSWVSEGASRVLSGDFARQGAGRLREVSVSWSGRNLRQHLESQIAYYGFNQILAYEDQSSMSQGIEMRSPFIDYRLVEFAFGLPDDAKFSDGRTKAILRDAFRAELPASIAEAGRKIGFATPFDQWGETEGFRRFVGDLVSSESFRRCSLWNARALSDRLTARGAAASAFPVWRFIVVALWLRLNAISNA